MTENSENAINFEFPEFVRNFTSHFFRRVLCQSGSVPRNRQVRGKYAPRPVLKFHQCGLPERVLRPPSSAASVLVLVVTAAFAVVATMTHHPDFILVSLLPE